MTDAEALHALARVYLMRRRDDWIARYRPPVSERDEGADYSDAGKDIYPRYQVPRAILDDVESFVGLDFSNVGEARQLLIEAGRIAESVFTHPPGGVIQQAAMDQERSIYVAYLTRIDIDIYGRPRPFHSGGLSPKSRSHAFSAT